MAVVKANGYGHGLADLGRYLDAQGVDGLMVGNFREAVALRQAGVGATVLNFGSVSATDPTAIVELGISQVVFTDEVDSLAREALRLGRKARVHLLIDTGLGRLGVPHHRASAFIERLARLDGIHIEGVMTALTEDREFDTVQLARFREVDAWADGKGIDLGLRHAASSDALLAYGEEFLLDMVRPGILLYGHYPSSEAARERVIAVKPALSLKARVAYVKILRSGDSVSYHRRFVADRPTSVATVPLGYSDGYPTAVANRGGVLIRGRAHPIIAAVTANHLVVRSEEVVVQSEEVVAPSAGATARFEKEGVNIGDEAVLWGEQGGSVISADEVAEQAGISVYRLLIGLSPLIPRVYRGVHITPRQR
jgi:alanine racemase